MNKLFLFVLTISFSNLFSMSISPIDCEIPYDKGQGYYTVANDDNSQKVVSVVCRKRFIDKDVVTHTEPTKDLIIYPKQIVLKPKEKRLVRVIWKAKHKIDKELAYRISFTEKNVDVDFGVEELEEDEKRAGMSFGIKFVGTVYIQPSKAASANIEIESYEKKEIHGEKFFVVTLENSGSRRKYIDMKDLELELLTKKTDGKKQWNMLSAELLQKHVGDSMLLLSGGKREIKIPCNEKELPENIVGVRITE